MEDNTQNGSSMLYRPVIGNSLAVASGLSFFFLCMILPLVGPGGSRVDYAGQNKAVFLLVLFVTFILAALSTYSKLGRRKVDGSPRPWFGVLQFFRHLGLQSFRHLGLQSFRQLFW